MNFSADVRRFGIALALLLSGGVAARALPVARLLHVRPVTQLRATRGGAFTLARERSALTFGSIVRTGRNGKAQIAFSNGTQIVLDERSQLEIMSAPSPSQPLVIRLFGALSKAFVKPQGETRIVTSAAIAAAKGTAFMVSLPTENTTEISVTEGEVEFFNPFGSVDIRANQRSTARIGQAPTPPVAVDASGLTQWTLDVSALPVEFEFPLLDDAPKNQLLAANVAAIEEAVRQRPQDVFWRGRLGALRYEQKRFDEARVEFSRVLAFVSQASERDDVISSEALGSLSHVSRAQGNAIAAIEEAERALKLAGNHVEAQHDAKIALALAYLSANDHANAQAALNGETGAMPQAVLGLCALRAGNNGEAETCLQSALKRDANCYQARALLALALLSQSDNVGALTHARAAVQLAPRSCMAQSVLAMTLFFSPYANLRREALNASEIAARLDPESPFALLAQGRALLARGRVDEARNALQNARAFAPDLPLLDVELGQVYLRLDQNPRAERAFRRALQKHPDDASGHAGLGLALAQQGDFKNARVEYQRALQIAPRNALARGNYALLLIERGELKSANELLRDGLGDGPDSGLLYARLAEASLFQQRLFEAGEYARRAVELLPDSSLARFQLGRVYLEQERVGQAEEQFRQAVTLDPLNAQARYALGLTRERVELGRDLTRPLGSAAAANFAGAGQALNVQNLQTPGAEERIQAALQDPTVVRSASRSFGDFQLEARNGSADSRDFEVSYLKESDDRRGVAGLIVQRDRTNGVRSNADSGSDRYGFTLGRKAQGSPLGFFLLAQNERSDYGGNDGEANIAFRQTARAVLRKPNAILGFNFARGNRQRTRVLLQVDRPEVEAKDAGGFTRNRLRSAHAEVRSDARLGERHLFSFGGALGTRRQNRNDLARALDPMFPDFASHTNNDYRQAELYVRDEFQLSRRVRVTGEMKALRLRNALRSEVVSPPGFPAARSGREVTVGLPTFIAEYRPDARSGLRVRYRRLFGTIEDFQLLAPTDVFSFSRFEAPLLSPLSAGDLLDLEYDRTFGGAAFLRVGAFQQSTNASYGPTGETFRDTRLRGVRLRFEGALNPATTFFTALDFNSGRGAVEAYDADDNPIAVRGSLTQVPRYSAEAGLQFLNRKGYFAQASVGFLGARARDVNTLATSRGHFASTTLVNVRVGRRLGLRFSAFAELTNAFDQKFVTGVSLQPGRQFRVGAVQRF